MKLSKSFIIFAITLLLTTAAGKELAAQNDAEPKVDGREVKNNKCEVYEHGIKLGTAMQFGKKHFGLSMPVAWDMLFYSDWYFGIGINPGLRKDMKSTRVEYTKKTDFTVMESPSGEILEVWWSDIYQDQFKWRYLVLPATVSVGYRYEGSKVDWEFGLSGGLGMVRSWTKIFGNSVNSMGGYYNAEVSVGIGPGGALKVFFGVEGGVGKSKQLPTFVPDNTNITPVPEFTSPSMSSSAYGGFSFTFLIPVEVNKKNR